MAATPGLYAIRIGGRLGVTALSAFPSMAPELKGRETVLTGVIEDQSALFGVLAQIEALGLELLELRQIEGAWPPGANHRDPATPPHLTGGKAGPGPIQPEGDPS